MPKLTESLITKIEVPAGKRDVLVFDEALRGFGIRKFDSGKASFFVKYNVGKQQRKLTLGPYLPGRLADMRNQAADVLAKARLGEDVQGAKKAARERKVATIGDLVPLYLKAIQPDLRPKTYIEYERYLTQHWSPMHGRPIDEVSRTEVVTIIDRVAEGAGRVSADRARAALGAFYSWVIDKGYRDSTPLINIRRRANGGSRERVLAEAEIKHIWRGLGDDEYSKIVKLLFLTAQRKTEIGDLRWSEIDFARRQIDLPSSRTKNRLPHIVPLSEPAIAILESQPRRLNRDYVFGQGSIGYQGWSKSKALISDRAALATTWTLHDIRRTAITLMNDRGIAQPHVVEAIVNHISGHKGGVAGVYNKSQYLDEKRRALDAWAEFLTELVR